jgi:serine/threonine protein kinase/Tol biopolymer transport system component
LPATSPERFGPYEVVAVLGAGGMGHVFRGRDPRLNRAVAIKVLAHAGSDPLRQRRLFDEAQAASALNHPNITTVYDVGTEHDTPYIVSELVEGASLRETLRHAPLGVREALDLAVQMADGLAAAHQAGIVHRDFKPENVMVTPDGRVKIVDFGLALVGARSGPPGGESEATLTIAGLIVGTVPYMSPEQARGATVDYRTDQFSLGVTLYEMLTGRRAFATDTAAQTLAAIIEDEPEPIGKLNPRVPAPVRWLIDRCLMKDPRQRYDSTGDLARDLRTIRNRLGEITAQPDPAPIDGPRSNRLWLTIAIVAASAALIVAVAGLLRWNTAESGIDRYRFTPLATDAGYQASPAWSPDGKTLAYVASVNGVLQIFTKPAGLPTRNQVTRSRFSCSDPMWSPDGTRIYYISAARDRDGLYSISAAGGDPEPVMEDVYRAALSPDGKTLAFVRGTPDGLRLWIASPIDSEPKPYDRAPFDKATGLIEATMHFAPDGTKLGAWTERGESHAMEADFWVVPLEGTSFRVSLPSEVNGLAPRFTWLRDSRHVLSALPRPTPGMHLWLMDTESTNARLITASGGMENDPALSPDGTRLALTLQQADYDLYELSVDRPPALVLATSRSEMDPVLRPDRDEIAFATDRTGRAEIWLRSQKGDSEERPLVTPSDFSTPTFLLSAPAFSPDGKTLAYNRAGPEGMQIWFSGFPGGRPIQLGAENGAQDWPSWSPDNAWLAYGFGVESPWVVKKIRPGAQTPAETIATDMDAFSPLQWSPLGDWIVYNSVNGLALVSPDGKQTRPLHEQSWMAFAWAADAQRVYGIRLSDDSQHLAFVSVDIRTGVERVHGPDMMPLPVASRVVRGMTRTSPTTFVASIVRVRSDVWQLENFLPSAGLWDRLRAAFSRKSR